MALHIERHREPGHFVAVELDLLDVRELAELVREVKEVVGAELQHAELLEVSICDWDLVNAVIRDAQNLQHLVRVRLGQLKQQPPE